MPAPSAPPPGRGRLSLLASLFVGVVALIAWYQHTLLLPLYVGLLAWLKALLQTLTPKLLLVLVKNGVFIKGRQLVTGLFAQSLVLSHRPWRRRLLAVKAIATATGLKLFERFVRSPLWFRVALALALLALTASSAYAFIALLIIPRPILEWLKVRTLAFLNKLGITRALDTLWHKLAPAPLRRRWHLFAKWRLGRRQVLISQRVHRRVERRLQRRLARRGREEEGG